MFKSAAFEAPFVGAPECLFVRISNFLQRCLHAAAFSADLCTESRPLFVVAAANKAPMQQQKRSRSPSAKQQQKQRQLQRQRAAPVLLTAAADWRCLLCSRT